MGLNYTSQLTFSNKTRIIWIDVAKGIGIILVVLGHAPRLELLNKYPVMQFINSFIYGFHMQFFFFLSGYVSEKHKASSFLKTIERKIKALLIPWVVYGAIIYLIVFVANLIPQIESILSASSYQLISIEDYILMALDSNNPYSYHLWYIFALFWIQIIVDGVKRIIHMLTKEGTKAYNAILWFVLLIEIIIFFFVGTHNQTLFFIKKNIVFYTLGVIIGRTKLDFRSNFYVVFGIVGILFTSLNVIFVKNEMISNSNLIVTLKDLHILIGIPSMIFFLVYISRKIERTWISNGLQSLGRYSYNVYLLHQPFCCAFLGIILLKWIGGTLLGDMLSIAICVIMSTVFPIIIIRMMYKLGLGRLMKLLLNISI